MGWVGIVTGVLFWWQIPSDIQARRILHIGKILSAYVTEVSGYLREFVVLYCAHEQCSHKNLPIHPMVSPRTLNKYKTPYDAQTSHSIPWLIRTLLIIIHLPPTIPYLNPNTSPTPSNQRLSGAGTAKGA